jgi:hypothetical protein
LRFAQRRAAGKRDVRQGVRDARAPQIQTCLRQVLFGKAAFVNSPTAAPIIVFNNLFSEIFVNSDFASCFSSEVACVLSILWLVNSTHDC